MIQAEYETTLNRVCLHLYVDRHYVEDYQMPMLQQNPIDGILSMDGCEVNGRGRYTYEIGGMISMKRKYEKVWMKREEIEEIIVQLLKITEELQRYMLVQDCLILKPEYIFYNQTRWFFCYLPGNEENLKDAFHELTEYFVKTLDYSDTEGILLTYQLHKATLQEHYDLSQIMKEYQERRRERKEKIETRSEEHQDKFSYKEMSNAAMNGSDTRYCETAKLFPGPEGALNTGCPADIQEKTGWKKPWWKAAKHMRKWRWGRWEDFILETDGQEEDPVV